MKTIKVYELYDGALGPSSQSRNYGYISKRLWHVAAVSIKQAIYLAAHDQWRKGGKGVGILEYSHCASDDPWKHDDGTVSYAVNYRHNQTLSA